jgi:uncharacterized protein (TIGR03435 family)
LANKPNSFRRLGACLLFLAALAATQAQTPQPSRSFEVAAIRPAPPETRGEGSWSLPNTGEFHVKSLPLSFLIQLAYNLDAKQIAGKPAWLDSELYDIQAKPEGGIALTREQLRPLLQNLLEQRFHLAAHHETKLVSGYALVLVKSGSKLVPTKGGVTPNFRDNVSPGNLKGRNWSTQFLAQTLIPAAGLPVIDRTGLTGSYDLALEYAPGLVPDSPLPSLFVALRETLGLKLESQKVSVEILVIDHIDRTPAEN